MVSPRSTHGARPAFARMRLITGTRLLPQAVMAVLAATGCGAGVEVVDAEQLAVITRPNIAGRDGGASLLHDGKSAWIFGDTVLSLADADGMTWHHNSFSLVDAGGGPPVAADDFSEPVDGAGAPLHFLEPTDEERAFNLAHYDFGDGCAEEPCGARHAMWPGTGVVDEERGRALVFYESIYAEPGDFNFSGRGSGIVAWADGDVRPVRDGDPQFKEGEPGFDHGTVVAGDDATPGEGFVYAFACDTDVFGAPCRLGRAALADALTRSAWRFYDGGAWVKDVKSAAHVVDGPANSVFFDEALGAYAMVYSPQLSREVKLRTAPALTGPWSGEVTLFQTDVGDDVVTYDAYAHPELDPSGATILVSYTRPNGAFLGSETVLERVSLR